MSCNAKRAWGRQAASYVCVSREYVENVEELKAGVVDGK